MHISRVWGLNSAAPSANIPEIDSVIRSNLQEVVLDVVVQHKDQSLATNLKASEFTVTESGVPQTIWSIRLAGGGEARVFAPPYPPAAA